RVHARRAAGDVSRMVYLLGSERIGRGCPVAFLLRRPPRRGGSPHLLLSRRQRASGSRQSLCGYRDRGGAAALMARPHHGRHFPESVARISARLLRRRASFSCATSRLYCPCQLARSTCSDFFSSRYVASAWGVGAASVPSTTRNRVWSLRLRLVRSFGPEALIGGAKCGSCSSPSRSAACASSEVKRSRRSSAPLFALSCFSCARTDRTASMAKKSLFIASAISLASRNCSARPLAGVLTRGSILTSSGCVWIALPTMSLTV